MPKSPTRRRTGIRAERAERLLPLLIDVEDGLADDVKLQSLAERFGASPFHFHRLFTTVLGETPKKHVERVRLERAALLLAVSDDSVLDIGLSVGFRNAETFARRFKKFLGYTPSGYRRMAKAAQAKRLASVDFFASSEYVLGRARFERLPRMSLLAIRRLGDYGALHDDYSGSNAPWGPLLEWAHARGIPAMPLRIGIFYDDPTLTPPALLRSDFCVPIEGRVAPTERIRSVDFSGGMHAIAEYTGQRATIINAFRGLADEIRRSARFDFSGGPPLEIVRALDVGGEPGVHRIDVCFPVKRKGASAASKNRQEGAGRRR